MRSSRRSFLRGMAGLALALSGLPRVRAATAPAVRHVIFLYLAGGPSHIDTFDPKPGTRAGGPFRAIPTAIPGVRFSEHLPRLAERAGKLAVVRNLRTTEGSHERARFLLHTGFSPVPGAALPAFGASLARLRGDPSLALPGFVALGGSAEGAGLHGPEFEPFVVRSVSGAIPFVRPAVPPERLHARLALQRAVNDAYAQTAPDPARRAQVAADRALALMESPLLSAFDLAGESPAAYGTSAVGRRCLIARRLIERGVTCVEVHVDEWDCHKDNFGGHRRLLADLDPAFAALLDDLSARDLLARTLIVCAGEFGRSPSINAEEGRDHHPACFSAVLAGGPLARGRVIGESDRDGDRPRGAALGVPDLLATLFQASGVDPTTRYLLGDRPITLGNGGRVVPELLA